MFIKDQEFDVQEISIEESPYRRDMTELLLSLATGDRTVVGFNEYLGLPVTCIISGERFDEIAINAKYCPIIEEVYGDTPREYRDNQPILYYTEYWMIDSNPRVFFLDGKMYKENGPWETK